jgi:hypothetical protein
MAYMPSNGWSPGIIPFGADETVYLVLESFGTNGAVYRETEVEESDLETIIGDLISGQFDNPLRVIAFNTLEHWADDVSANIAAEIQTRCDIEGLPIPEHVSDFVQTHNRPTGQLPLRLV